MAELIRQVGADCVEKSSLRNETSIATAMRVTHSLLGRLRSQTTHRIVSTTFLEERIAVAFFEQMLLNACIATFDRGRAECTVDEYAKMVTDLCLRYDFNIDAKNAL